MWTFCKTDGLDSVSQKIKKKIGYYSTTKQD